MKRTLIAIVMALALVAIPVSSVLADTSADVTVTAAPGYLSISNTPDTWTINALGGGAESGLIKPDTTYYANPITDGDDTIPPSATVVDTECNFTVTNDGNIDVDLAVTWGDFTGGGAAMANINQDAGDNNVTNGATDYLAYCWYEGMTYANKVLVKAAGSDLMYTDGLAGSAELDWGVEILTRTDAWSSDVSSTSTLTITASYH
jgi:hypothetical protein